VPYVIALLPMLAFSGVVGAVVSLIRGRRRSAIAFGVVGAGAAVAEIGLFYAAL
jgi:hypothetical protein